MTLNENMTRDEVITRFCELASKVGRERFDNLEAHDCFCRGDQAGFQFSPAVMQFIEEAVQVSLDAWNNVGGPRRILCSNTIVCAESKEA